jgi:tetratricopeptide (TPR) repeat protein
MEAYCLNSKLVDNNKEYTVKTTNNVQSGTVSSEVFVNGDLADTIKFPTPEHIDQDEIEAFIELTHLNKKKELELLLSAYHHTLNSKKPKMLYHLGLAFYYKRFYVEALDLFKRTLKCDSEFNNGYKYLSMTHLKLGNNRDAMKAAEKAIFLKPEYADYRNCLGEVFLANGKYEDALDEFKKATEINLYYGDAYFNLGLTNVLVAQKIEDTNISKLINSALDYFKKALMTDPEYNLELVDKGQKALESSDLIGAYDIFTQAKYENKERKRYKTAPLHMKYVIHPDLVTEGIVSDRISYLKKEIKHNPSYVDLYSELATCYLNQSILNWRKGIDLFKQALEIKPELTKFDDYAEEAKKASSVIEHVVNNITEKD